MRLSLIICPVRDSVKCRSGISDHAPFNSPNISIAHFDQCCYRIGRIWTSHLAEYRPGARRSHITWIVFRPNAATAFVDGTVFTAHHDIINCCAIERNAVTALVDFQCCAYAVWRMLLRHQSDIAHFDRDAAMTSAQSTIFDSAEYRYCISQFLFVAPLAMHGAPFHIHRDTCTPTISSVNLNSGLYMIVSRFPALGLSGSIWTKCSIVRW